MKLKLGAFAHTAPEPMRDPSLNKIAVWTYCKDSKRGEGTMRVG